MIRVFSFIGSMAGERSSTARYSDNLAGVLKEKAKEAGKEVSYERITADQIRSLFCLSCCNCFKKGICPLDEQDDMAGLKEKIRQSDILFFGSPVYMSDMSGVTKNVIDRISYWAHRYELAGKPAAVFAVTDSSFGQETAQHMAEMLSYTGLVTVHTGHAKRGMAQHPNLYLEEDMLPIWEEAADRLLDALGSVLPYITDRDELKFRTRKKIAERALKLAEVTGLTAWDEHYVLRRRGVLEAQTYADFLRQAQSEP